MAFHHNVRSTVKLSENEHTVEGTRQSVFSDVPLTDLTYNEFKFRAKNDEAVLYIGVTKSDPDILNDVPRRIIKLPETWCIDPRRGRKFENSKIPTTNQATVCQQEGDIWSIVGTNSGNVYIYHNKKEPWGSPAFNLSTKNAEVWAAITMGEMAKFEAISDSEKVKRFQLVLRESYTYLPKAISGPVLDQMIVHMWAERTLTTDERELCMKADTTTQKVHTMLDMLIKDPLRGFSALLRSTIMSGKRNIPQLLTKNAVAVGIKIDLMSEEKESKEYNRLLEKYRELANFEKDFNDFEDFKQIKFTLLACYCGSIGLILACDDKESLSGLIALCRSARFKIILYSMLKIDDLRVELGDPTLSLEVTITEFEKEPNFEPIFRIPALLEKQMLNDMESVGRLLQEGADPNTCWPDGVSGLHVAACTNNIDLAELLLEYKADVKIQNTSGDTPLHLARRNKHINLAELLLRAGAREDMKNAKGQTSAEIANTRDHASQDKDHTEVFKVLQDYKKNRRKYKIKESMPQVVDFKSEPSKKKKVTDTGGKCAAFTIATEFIKALGLSDEYFEKEFDVCFCTTCHTTRGDNLYYTRGDPPKDYGLPVGWVKFGLKIPAWATVQQALEKWHVAFHGTKVPNVEKILRTGDLLNPVNVTPSGFVLRTGHFDDKDPNMAPPPGFDIYKIYFSPSIRYSGCSVYAPLWKWKNHHLRVNFQVRTQPGTYDIGPENIGAKGPIDPHFLNSELEWSTKRRGVTVLVGLLVKVEGLGGEPDTKMYGQAASGAAALPQPKLRKDKETRPEPLAGRKATLLYPFTYAIAPGVDIALEAGDEVTVISEMGETALSVKVPRVKQPIIIQRNVLDL